MNKKMLIDASYKEETRVVILDSNCIESYDIENSAKKQIKGNIYLAKVIRIEPSLQAAFVDYGGNRHGFLAFNEIHPDYYQIPVADRKKLIELQELNKANAENANAEQDNGFTNQLLKNYKIQEVIHKRQVVLVQVVKEERGNKGAALTTYLSLAGRYCVLMPNSLKNGGVSRKITSPMERKRLKDIITELNIPPHMGIIIRTAGAQCPKSDTLKDGEYLLHLWDEIRNLTMRSIAPAMIYEDSNLLKLALRDIYTSDINEILVDGEEAWAQARDYMRALMPQNVHKLHLWRDQKQSLFAHYKIEHLIDQMLSPIVQLKSGGYLVINQTEALVAIDVNSGRSIRERDLEETALRTNQEAALEISRQLRLRDLAGLIVIDFIDMENKKHNYLVERRLKSLLHKDRARIQIGSISSFGLLEMTRQRLRPSIAEFAFTPCSVCNGTGIIRSDANISLQILRQIDEEARKMKPGFLTVSLSSSEIALYILNQKRTWLADIEKKYKIKIDFIIDSKLSVHQVSFTNKNDTSLDQENETGTSSDVLLQDSLFVREIPIQSRFEYSQNPDTTAKNDQETEPQLQTKSIIYPFDPSEDEQPAVSFYPVLEQDVTEEMQPLKKQTNRRSSRYSNRNRHKKTHIKTQPNKKETVLDIEYPSALSQEETVSAFAPPLITIDINHAENDYDSPAVTVSGHESNTDNELDNQDQDKEVPKLTSEASPVSETEEKETKTKKSPRKTRARNTTTTKTPRTQKKTTVKTEDANEVVKPSENNNKEIQNVEENDNKPEKSVQVTKKTTTRSRKPSSTRKTTTKKKEKETEKEQSVIQPIVIDDTPSVKPRSGWWKR